MTNNPGQDSAPRADICSRSGSDARPQQRQDGDKPADLRCPLCSSSWRAPQTRGGRIAMDPWDQSGLYHLLRRTSTGSRVFADDVDLLSRLLIPKHFKRVLMDMHTFGLVTDEQVERAFAQHPELRSA